MLLMNKLKMDFDDKYWNKHKSILVSNQLIGCTTDRLSDSGSDQSKSNKMVHRIWQDLHVFHMSLPALNSLFISHCYHWSLNFIHLLWRTTRAYLKPIHWIGSCSVLCCSLKLFIFPFAMEVVFFKISTSFGISTENLFFGNRCKRFGWNDEIFKLLTRFFPII